jgi:hypothetical protein
MVPRIFSLSPQEHYLISCCEKIQKIRNVREKPRMREARDVMRRPGVEIFATNSETRSSSIHSAAVFRLVGFSDSTNRTEGEKETPLSLWW